MIYFIQDCSLYLIKIGYTSGDVNGRLCALQTGSPVGLVLLFTMPGEMPDEAALHLRFAGLRERGEWFRPGPPLLQFLLKASGDGGCESFSDSDHRQALELLIKLQDKLHPLTVGMRVRDRVNGDGCITNLFYNDFSQRIASIKFDREDIGVVNCWPIDRSLKDKSLVVLNTTLEQFS
jgi:hypothetical protein